MHTKKWEVVHNNNQIIVTNDWNFSGDVREQILINNEVVAENSYNAGDVKFKKAVGAFYKVQRGSDLYKFFLGSAWHLFGMACRIEANGKYIGGNRVVLFAKEPGQE